MVGFVKKNRKVLALVCIVVLSLAVWWNYIQIERFHCECVTDDGLEYEVAIEGYPVGLADLSYKKKITLRNVKGKRKYSFELLETDYFPTDLFKDSLGAYYFCQTADYGCMIIKLSDLNEEWVSYPYDAELVPVESNCTWSK